MSINCTAKLTAKLLYGLSLVLSQDDMEPSLLALLLCRERRRLGCGAAWRRPSRRDPTNRPGNSGGGGGGWLGWLLRPALAAAALRSRSPVRCVAAGRGALLPPAPARVNFGTAPPVVYRPSMISCGVLGPGQPVIAVKVSKSRHCH